MRNEKENSFRNARARSILKRLKYNSRDSFIIRKQRTKVKLIGEHLHRDETSCREDNNTWN